MNAKDAVKTVSMSVALLGVMCLMPSSASADFRLNPVTPVPTPLVAHGDPQEGVASWQQHFCGSAIGAFDLLAVQMASPSDFFSTPAHNDFSQPTWGLEIDGLSMASASGGSVGELGWDVRFSGDMSDPLVFDYVAFSGDEIVSAARARWSGSGWTIATFLGGEGALWSPAREDVVGPIPAPGAALLAIVGLGTIGWIRRRTS